MPEFRFVVVREDFAPPQKLIQWLKEDGYIFNNARIDPREPYAVVVSASDGIFDEHACKLAESWGYRLERS